MDTLLQALPQITGIIEKGGVVGLLVIISAFLLYERIQKNKEIVRLYRERDRFRLFFVKAKSALENHNIKIDTTDIDEIIGREAL